MMQMIFFLFFVTVFLLTDDTTNKKDHSKSESVTTNAINQQQNKKKSASSRHRNVDSTAFADVEPIIEKEYKDILLADLEEKIKIKKGLIRSRNTEYSDYIHSFSNQNGTRFSWESENDFKSNFTFEAHSRIREENQPIDGLKTALAREDGPAFALQMVESHAKAKESLFVYDENRLFNLKKKIKDYERKVQYIPTGHLGYYNNQLKKFLEEAKKAKIESQELLKNKEEQFAQFLVVAFPSNVPDITQNLDSITSNVRAAIKHQEILDDCLNLHMLEDEIQFSEAQIKINNQIITKTKRTDLAQEMADIETYSLGDLKSSRIKYENQLNDIRQLVAQTQSVVSTKEAEIQLHIAQLENGWRWFNPLAKSTSTLKADLEKLQKEHQEALIKSHQLQYELSFYEQLSKEVKESIVEQDTLNYQDIAQELYENKITELSEEDMQSPLMKAVQIAVKTHNKSCIKSYLVKSRTREVLQHFGHKPIAYMKFDGDAAQQFIYKSIVDSVNKLSLVNMKEKKVFEVVEYALKFQEESIKLTKQHKLSQALEAHRAFDSLVDCAVVLSDVVLAFGEGVLDSCENNAKMAMHIGVIAGELAGNRPALGKRVSRAVNKASLALTSFFTLVANDAQETLSARSEEELIALANKRKKHGEAFDEICNKIAYHYKDLGWRDKVKIAGTLFGDIITLECVGSLFKYLDKLAPLEKTATVLERIVESPMRVVAEEAIEITTQTANKDKNLVQQVIKFAQSESEFINAGEKVSEKAVEFIEHLETKGAKHKILSSGEKCRIPYPEDLYKRELIWAPEKYNEIRSFTDDIQTIAKNTGLRESKIKRIKKHLFYDEHILRDGVSRFGPDPEIAAAWDRLLKGDFIKSDLSLLEHEYFESKFEKLFKTTYDVAHEKTITSGRIWNVPE